MWLVSSEHRDSHQIFSNRKCPSSRTPLAGLLIAGVILKLPLPSLKSPAALPDAALVHYHLGMSYVGTGQEANASKEFETALSKPHNNALAEAISVELTTIAKP
jgi:hypothetical protein